MLASNEMCAVHVIQKVDGLLLVSMKWGYLTNSQNTLRKTTTPRKEGKLPIKYVPCALDGRIPHQRKLA